MNIFLCRVSRGIRSKQESLSSTRGRGDLKVCLIIDVCGTDKRLLHSNNKSYLKTILIFLHGIFLSSTLSRSIWGFG